MTRLPAAPRLAAALVLASLAACRPAAPPGTTPGVTPALDLSAPGDHRIALEHDGRSRTAIVHVPPGLGRAVHAPPAQAAAAPLVLMLHGGTGTAEHAARVYGWSELADAEGFVVAYPDGTGRFQTWNGVHCCGYALREDVDDVGFLRALVDRIAAGLPIDRRRVYATGMSNGAMMAYRLGGEAADVFAAIGPVAGSTAGQPAAGEAPRWPADPVEPVSVVAFNGLEDRNVPYAGGHPTAGLTRARWDVPVREGIRLWARAAGCHDDPVRTELAGGAVVREAFPGCDAGADVVLYTVVDGRHAWPGGAAPARPGADRPTRHVDATATIWAFFEAHPKTTGLD